MNGFGPTQYDSFEHALLVSARNQEAPAGAMRKTATRLGVSLPAAGLAGLAQLSTSSAVGAAAGAPGGLAQAAAANAVATGNAELGAAAGAATAAGSGGTAAVAATQPVAKATLLALVGKYLGAGVVAGAVAVGGAHEAAKSESGDRAARPDPSAELVGRPKGESNRSVPTLRRSLGTSGSVLVGSARGEESFATGSPRSSTVLVLRSAGAAVPVSMARDPEGPTAVTTYMGQMPADSYEDEVAQPGRIEGSVASFPLELSPRSEGTLPQKKEPQPKGLELERLLLGRARSALDQGLPRTALRELGSYAVRCRDGVLRSEANLLRVEALIHTGERQSALWLARQEIARTSRRRTVQRVREMFAEPTGDPEKVGENPKQ